MSPAAAASIFVVAYVPFLQPLPIWDVWWGWAALLLPLCAAVSVVYKAIKCRTMADVPREAATIFVMIIGGMILAALLLAGLVRVMQ